MTAIASKTNIYQRLDNECRYTSIFGGRGGAKSFHFSLFLVCISYNVLNQVFLYTRYTMSSAEISIIPEFREKIQLMGWEEDFHIKGSVITNLQTGTKIIFSGIKTSSGNQTARLKSIQGLSVWVLDEAEEMVNKTEFDTIDDSIRTKGFLNKVFLIYNTNRIDHEHWIYKHFHLSGEREDTEYIRATYLDNLHNLDPSFIAKAEQAKIDDLEYYNINYMGHFPQLRDSVFQKGFTTFVNDPTEYDWVGVGGDFGFTDNPSAAVKVWRCGKALYLREVLYSQGLTNQDIAEKLGEDRKEINVWDSAEKKSIAELRRAGVNAYPADKGPGSVYFGIKKLQQLEIFIHAQSTNLQSEWKAYRWKKAANGEYMRNGKGDRVPVKTDDHAIDAVRYIAAKLSAWT